MTETLNEPLADRVSGLISNGEFELPPLPELAVKMRTAMEDESTSAADIAALIRTEPAVAAALLRTANSAAFGGLKTISDLSQAISRLGMKRVQTLVTGLLAQGQFDGGSQSSRQAIELLWNHAIASATVARKLASREGYEAEVAFVAGLLHGIGRLIVVRALDHLSKKDPELALTDEATRELVDGLQFELGFKTLTAWNLPEDICEAARAMDPAAEPSTREIIPIVQAADLIAKKLSMHPEPDPDLNLMDQDAIDTMEISEIELGALMIDLEDEIEEIKSAFNGG